MSKFPLTIEMADTLRELRLQNKIASKEITAALGRSPSYISKIEGGAIKSISEEELDIITEAIELGFIQELFKELVKENLGHIVYWSSFWDFMPLSCYEEYKQPSDCCLCLQLL